LFIAHGDGCYETPDRKERSYFTLHLYLNDPVGKNGQENLEGGATTFWGFDMIRRLDVVPKAGRVLLFQQRGLIHSGDEVTKGTKLTMRTDIMFKKEGPGEEEPIDLGDIGDVPSSTKNVYHGAEEFGKQLAG
jgi:hypothetical protein